MRLIQRSEGTYNWNDVEDCELCKISEEELDALYDGVIDDANDIKARETVRLAPLLTKLEAWAKWRKGQCDFPDGLSNEETRLIQDASRLSTDEDTMDEEDVCERD